jgi:hypothetical protein
VTRIFPSIWRSTTMVALSLVASFSRTFSSMSVLINHFVPTILSRKRMALRVTASVTCIGATPKARRQAFTVWIEDSLKGLLSDLALPLWKGTSYFFVTCNLKKPLRVTERAGEAIEQKVFNRQFDRVQVFTLIR